jgi:hypothetical protein
MRKLAYMAVMAIALGAASAAQAFPAAADVATPSNPIVKVRNGCGLGWHRGPWGYCRPNGVPYVGRPYAYAPARCWWVETAWGPRRVCAW